MAGTISKENGKLGGRPLASHTIQTQIQRHRLVVLLEDKVEAIFNALAVKAMDGDVGAAKELFDRAWGKPPQFIEMDANIDDKRKTLDPEARKVAAKAYVEYIKSQRG